MPSTSTPGKDDEVAPGALSPVLPGVVGLNDRPSDEGPRQKPSSASIEILRQPSADAKVGAGANAGLASGASEGQAQAPLALSAQSPTSVGEASRPFSGDLMLKLDALLQQHQKAVREQVETFFAEPARPRRPPARLPEMRICSTSDSLGSNGPTSNRSSQPCWQTAVEGMDDVSPGASDTLGRPTLSRPRRSDEATSATLPREQQVSIAVAPAEQPPSAASSNPPPLSPQSSSKRRGSLNKFRKGNQTVDSLESTLHAEVQRLTVEQNSNWWSRLHRNIPITAGKSIVHHSDNNTDDVDWETRLRELTSSWYYEVGAALMIVLNAAVIAGETQYDVEQAEHGRMEVSQWFRASRFIFCLIFTFDLALRVFAQGALAFCFSEERGWNAIDVTVVISLLLDVFLILAVDGSDYTIDFSVVRVIRLLRVVKVLRVLRNFSYMRDMRIMVSMLCSAVVPLTWIAVIMFSVCMTFAIFFTDGAAGYLRDHHNSNDSVVVGIRTYYGSLPRSVSTLFMSITGGVDWENVARPLADISGWHVMMFYAFIAFSMFAMLNVVSAIFIDSTIQRSKSDREFVIQTEIEGKREFIRTMHLLFVELDRDGSGEISLEELQAHMLVPKVEAYFKHLDLDVSQAKKLFRLMDLDKSGTISREEFIVGCSRLRGEAKELDIAILQYEIRWIKSLLVNLGHHLDEHFRDLHRLATPHGGNADLSMSSPSAPAPLQKDLVLS